MHDDDEERFPRISLWQFLKAVLWIPLRFYDRWFGHNGIDDAASIYEERKRKGASKSDEVRPPDMTGDEGQL
jgi:hypothetical protein